MKIILMVLVAFTILSTNGNCQSAYQKYRTNDLNQLSREQLMDRLNLNKKLVGFDIGAVALGTVFIIAGSSIIRKANEEEVTVKGFFDFLHGRIMGGVLVTAGVICDIGGIILLPINLSQISKINKILKQVDINLGLINYHSENTFSLSDIHVMPAISINIHFKQKSIYRERE